MDLFLLVTRAMKLVSRHQRDYVNGSLQRGLLVALGEESNAAGTKPAISPFRHLLILHPGGEVIAHGVPPGLGSYTIDAIQSQDFAIVRAMVFLGSVLYIVGLILTDVSYTMVDPRVRFE